MENAYLIKSGEILKKHVALIHAYSLMTRLQRNIFNVLLKKAQGSLIEHDDKPMFITCHESLSEISNSIKFNSKNTQYLKESIDKMASLTIEWNLLKDRVSKRISFLNLRILHGSPTFYTDGTFNFSFHRIMLDLNQDPNIYGSIDLGLQTEFESKYSHSLYENGSRFVGLNKSKIIELDTYKKMLGVTRKSYDGVSELTRSIIKPAVEEVNDRANFIITLDKVKTGGKIIGFEMTANNKKRIERKKGGESYNEDKNISIKIKEIFPLLKEIILNDIISRYPKNYILEKIKYTETYAKKDECGRLPIPYFISALKNDYKSKSQNLQPDQRDRQEDIKPTPVNPLDDEILALRRDLVHWEHVALDLCDNDNSFLAENNKKIINQIKKRIKEVQILKKEEQIAAKDLNENED